MVRWHHRLNGRRFGWTPEVGDGQGGLACCSSWVCKELDTKERLNRTELKLDRTTWCLLSSLVYPLRRIFQMVTI